MRHLALEVPSGLAHRVAYHLRQHLAAFCADASVREGAFSSLLIITPSDAVIGDLREELNLAAAVCSVTGIIHSYEIDDAEVERLMRSPVKRSRFTPGQRVFITAGQLKNADGIVREINADTQTAKVAVLLAGREPEVELPWAIIELCAQQPVLPTVPNGASSCPSPTTQRAEARRPYRAPDPSEANRGEVSYRHAAAFARRVDRGDDAEFLTRIVAWLEKYHQAPLLRRAPDVDEILRAIAEDRLASARL